MKKEKKQRKTREVYIAPQISLTQIELEQVIAGSTGTSVQPDNSIQQEWIEENRDGGTFEI